MGHRNRIDLHLDLDLDLALRKKKEHFRGGKIKPRDLSLDLPNDLSIIIS